VRRSGWAILDQAVFAGATFVVLNVVLARKLPSAEYGAFTLSYSILLFLGNLHESVLGEPATVFGAGRYAAMFHGYLRILLTLHFLIAAAGAAILVAIGAILSRSDASLGWAITGAGLAVPFLLLLWLFRRAVCVRGDISRSVLAGLVYWPFCA
jgi:O-antigen/teichoic acid export membrane protein